MNIEFSVWIVWTLMVIIAFILGMGVGWLMKRPEKWKPENTGV